MKSLELKVPPVALSLLFLALMAGGSYFMPLIEVNFPYQHMIAFDLVSIGVIIAIMAVLSFSQNNTTVNPTTPDKTSSIVAHGIYKFSRNPMYLGMLLALMGFVVYFGSLSSLLLLPLFVLYMNQFQIKPEERFLAEKFGEQYLEYKQRVRRWI